LVVLASLATSVLRVVEDRYGELTPYERVARQVLLESLGIAGICCFLLIQLRFFALYDHQTARFRRDFRELSWTPP
jgi:hypothetical protein